MAKKESGYKVKVLKRIPPDIYEVEITFPSGDKHKDTVSLVGLNTYLETAVNEDVKEIMEKIKKAIEYYGKTQVTNYEEAKDDKADSKE